MDNMKQYTDAISYMNFKQVAPEHFQESLSEETITEEELEELAQETLADLEKLDQLYQEAIEIQDKLAEAGIDLDEMFSVEEGIQQMSKTKQLIARRKAGRSKQLSPTYQQGKRKPGKPIKR